MPVEALPLDIAPASAFDRMLRVGKSGISSSGRAHTVTMGKYTVGKFTLRVGRSRTGRGVFACEDIPKGSCIIEYIGKDVSDEEKTRDRGRYLFSVSSRKTIDGNIRENRARFINHACTPNCEAVGPNGRVFIMARRRIKAGEELTYNYGKEYFDKFIKPKGCKCPKCAKA